MIVDIEGKKTYDRRGDTGDSPCAFLIIVKQGSTIINSQAVSSDYIVVDQKFTLHGALEGMYYSTEDYKIIITDYSL